VKYKRYDAHGNVIDGAYAQVFEEEYKSIVGGMQLRLEDSPSI